MHVELVRDELGPITPVDQRCLDAIEAAHAPEVDPTTVEALCPWVRGSATCPYGGDSPATIISTNACMVEACYGEALDRNLVADGFQGADCGVPFDCSEEPCVGMPLTFDQCEYALTLVRDQ